MPLLLLCRAAEPGSPPPGSPKPKPSGSPRPGPARRQGTCSLFDYFRFTAVVDRIPNFLSTTEKFGRPEFFFVRKYQLKPTS